MHSANMLVNNPKSQSPLAIPSDDGNIINKLLTAWTFVCRDFLIYAIVPQKQRHLDKRSLCRQQQQEKHEASRATGERRASSIERRFSWQASRLLLLANIGADEPGAGLRLVLFDYAVAKGKRQSAKKAKDVVDVLPSLGTGTDSGGIERG